MAKSNGSTQTTLTEIDEFLQLTQIEDEFSGLCTELLSSAELPYNPYPWLVSKLRVKTERYEIDGNPEKHRELLQFVGETLTAGAASHSKVTCLVHPVGCDFVWGLKHIVQAVSATQLWQYRWLIADITPKTKNIQPSQAGYSVAVALVGQSLFHGRLYRTIHSVDMRLEFIVAGTGLRQGIETFLDVVFTDIALTDGHSQHILLGVYVPVSDGNHWKKQMWVYADIIKRKDEFRARMKDAVEGHRLIITECLFCLDDNGSRFVRGQKQYQLTFVEISSNIREPDRVTEFSDVQSGMTIYEGVFFSLSQAEAYVLVHSHQSDSAADKNVVTHKSARHVRIVTPCSSLPKLQHLDDSSDWELSCSEPVTASDADSLASAAVRQNVRRCFERKLASMQLETEPFDVVHYVFLLFLLSTEDEPLDACLLTELYSLARSRAGRLFILMQLNRTVRELLYRLTGLSQQRRNDLSQMMNWLLSTYKDGMSAFFTDFMSSADSGDIAWKNVISQQLSVVSEKTAGHFEQQLPLMESVQVLKNLYSYTYTVYLLLLSNILASCPQISKIMTELKERYTDEARQSNVREAFKFQPTRSVGPASNSVETVNFKHGFEDSPDIQHKSLVINVELHAYQSVPDLSPSKGRKTVMAGYVTDCHLDQIWRDFLYDIAGSYSLSSSKLTHVDLRSFYRKLLATLQQSAIKMDLCGENDDELSSRLSLLTPVEPLTAGSHIYRLQTYDIYGLQPTLSVVDGPAIESLKPLIAPLLHSDQDTSYGSYTVVTCCAVSGNAVLYGRMDPYLSTIVLHEHCYISGPRLCSAEVVQLYAKIIHKHLLNLYKDNECIVTGIYFGDTATEWCIEDVVEMKKGFAAETEHHLLAKAPVYFKAFVKHDWRLICIEKRLILHYCSEDNTSIMTFGCDNSSVSWYSTIFFDAEKASYHFERLHNYSSGGNPGYHTGLRNVVIELDKQIVHNTQHIQWLELYQAYLWKSLLLKDTQLLCATWRMLHSVSRRLEYVLDLGLSLQQLVHHVIKQVARDEEGLKDVDTAAVTKSDDGQKVVTRQRAHIDPTQLGAIMSDMMMALQQVVKEVCACSVLDVVLAKLESITNKSQDDSKAQLITDLQTILKFDEVLHMLSAVRDAAAADAHLALLPKSAATARPKLHSALRPASIASVYLRDHDEQAD